MKKKFQNVRLSPFHFDKKRKKKINLRKTPLLGYAKH